MKVGNFVVARLHALAVRSICGYPGDGDRFNDRNYGLI
jgi:hypothetical protein